MRTTALILLIALNSAGCVALRRAGVAQADKAAGGLALRELDSNAAKIEALAAEQQDPEAKAAMVAIVAENRALAERLEAEVAERSAAGEETPWIKTLGANWLEVLLGLGLLGAGGLSWKQRATLRKLVANREYLQALAIAAKDGIGHALEKLGTSRAEMTGELAADIVKEELTEAVERNPDLPNAGLKEHIEKAINGGST